eukprot:jgi/Botrbrau1/17037/Bobra.49_2s0093.1
MLRGWAESLSVFTIIVIQFTSHIQADPLRDLVQTPTKDPALSKRGVGTSIHFYDIRDVLILQAFKDLAWWYTWGPRPQSLDAIDVAHEHDLEFVPMLWYVHRMRPNMTINTRSKYLLGYNEPNVRSQANTPPEEAAEAYEVFLSIAERNELSPVSHSPAPCWGYDDSSDCITRSPFDWWNQFYTKCGELGANCDSDFIATHLYTCDANALASYINEVWQRYKKPIWMTEFACCTALSNATLDENIATQISFMRAAMHLMDSDPRIFRYAWFGPRVGQYPCVGEAANLMNTDGSLTTLGKVYAGQAIDASSLPPVIAQAVTAPVPNIPVVGWSDLCHPYDISGAVKHEATQAKASGNVSALRQFVEAAQKCGYQDYLLYEESDGHGLQAAKDLMPPLDDEFDDV